MFTGWRGGGVQPDPRDGPQKWRNALLTSPAPRPFQVLTLLPSPAAEEGKTQPCFSERHRHNPAPQPIWRIPVLRGMYLPPGPPTTRNAVPWWWKLAASRHFRLPHQSHHTVTDKCATDRLRPFLMPRAALCNCMHFCHTATDRRRLEPSLRNAIQQRRYP